MTHTEKYFLTKVAKGYIDPEQPARDAAWFGPAGLVYGMHKEHSGFRPWDYIKADTRAGLTVPLGAGAGAAVGAVGGAASEAALAGAATLLSRGKIPFHAGSGGAMAGGMLGALNGAWRGIHHGVRKSLENSNKKNAPVSTALHHLKDKVIGK